MLDFLVHMGPINACPYSRSTSCISSSVSICTGGKPLALTGPDASTFIGHSLERVKALPYILDKMPLSSSHAIINSGPTILHSKHALYFSAQQILQRSLNIIMNRQQILDPLYEDKNHIVSRSE
jgi:hypothetical protein